MIFTMFPVQRVLSWRVLTSYNLVKKVLSFSSADELTGFFFSKWCFWTNNPLYTETTMEKLWALLEGYRMKKEAKSQLSGDFVYLLWKSCM